VIKGIHFPSGLIYAGDRLQVAVTTEDPDRDTVYLTYEWQINGKSIIGNDQDQLSGEYIHSGDQIVVSVTPSDPFSSGAVVDSPRMIVPNRSPAIVSTPPAADKKGVYLYQLVGQDPDGDPLRYTILTGPPDMKIDPLSGLLRWQSSSITDNKSDVVIEVIDGKGGTATQQFRIETAAAP
jgi:hypothetical protein